jgi:hypothetical protein
VFPPNGDVFAIECKLSRHLCGLGLEHCFNHHFFVSGAEPDVPDAESAAWRGGISWMAKVHLASKRCRRGSTSFEFDGPDIVLEITYS